MAQAGPLPFIGHSGAVECPAFCMVDVRMSGRKAEPDEPARI